MKTETSITSPIRIDVVVPENDMGGWVALSFAPGKKDIGAFAKWDRDLGMDLDRLKLLGVTTIVPFLEDHELELLKIPNMVAEAQARGIHVRRFPFHDGGIPRDVDAAVQLVREIVERYDRGERVSCVCRGGLGRSGMMGACIRLTLGLDVDPLQAIAAVRQIRSERAIETKQQEDFIARFHGKNIRGG